jgi:hypothetical protein
VADSILPRSSAVAADPFGNILPLPTYSYEIEQAGGANKIHLALSNPAASGVELVVVGYWQRVPIFVGTVSLSIVTFETRLATALTAGVDQSAKIIPRYSGNPAAKGKVTSAPTGATDRPDNALVESLVSQFNAAQNPSGYAGNLSPNPFAQALVLKEEEIVYWKEVAVANVSNMRVGVLWYERPKP